MSEPMPNGMNELPDVEQCRAIFKAAAMLDAILMPDWEYRYYSFNANWAAGEELASMRDGEGSDYFALFTEAGLMVKGFDLDHARSEVGMQEPSGSQAGASAGSAEPLPDVMQAFLREPAFAAEDATFRLWHLRGSGGWSADRPYTRQELALLELLWGGPRHYRDWAAGYYELDIDAEAVRCVFESEPLTPELLSRLNADVSLDDLREEIAEIGYPIQAGSRP